MTIPDFQTLMRPVFALLADGEVRRSRHVKDAMVEQYELTPEERAQMLPVAASARWTTVSAGRLPTFPRPGSSSVHSAVYYASPRRAAMRCSASGAHRHEGTGDVPGVPRVS